MKENPEFIGRHYDENEKDNLKKALNRWSDESLKQEEGESEKSEEEVRMINTINLIIRSELESLGIEGHDDVPLEKVHILSSEIFKRMFPDFQGNAFFLSTSDVVYFERNDSMTGAQKFSTLLHELVHRASVTKFYGNKEDGGIHDARVGYRIRSAWKEPKEGSKLLGFNEFMTDFTVYKILSKNQSILERDFGITKKDIRGPIYSYFNYSPIFDQILLKISKDKDIPLLEVVDDLERGLFEPNILVLKDVESSFGKGSLKVLSLLGSLKGDNCEKLDEMIKNFFMEKDESKRVEMGDEINKFADESRRL